MAIRLDSNASPLRSLLRTSSAPNAPAASVPAVAGDELKIRAGGGGTSGTYTVAPGDYLIKIAGEQLGDESRWHEIYDLNRDQISNPDLIFPGQVLRMPAKAQASPPWKPWTPSVPSGGTSKPSGNTPAPGTPATPVAVPPVFHPPVPPQPPVSNVPTPAPGRRPTPAPAGPDALSSGLREGGVMVKNYQYFHSAPGLANGFMDNPWGNTRFGTISGTLTEAGSKVVGFLKHNVATAALFSALSNGLDFVRGRETAKQALEGFGADTAAYAGIGAASTAIGAAVGSVLGPVGTLGGMIVGSVAGVAMGWLYEKFARTPIMNALGKLFGR